MHSSHFLIIGSPIYLTTETLIIGTKERSSQTVNQIQLTLGGQTPAIPLSLACSFCLRPGLTVNTGILYLKHRSNLVHRFSLIRSYPWSKQRRRVHSSIRILGNNSDPWSTHWDIRVLCCPAIAVISHTAKIIGGRSGLRIPYRKAQFKICTRISFRIIGRGPVVATPVSIPSLYILLIPSIASCCITTHSIQIGKW